ncbi:hypothetical protein [Glutamicibacter protophormiae]|uniref:hypothetical protein n=1 Tax=Glutamicibacter protophormiae TaxID=37930 RepID=UPI003A938BFF
MTIWDTLVALRYHWAVAVFGVIATVLALVAVSDQQTVYYSRVSAYFFAPASSVYPNVLSTTSLDLVDTAGAVAKRINGTTTIAKVASTDATIVGRGIYDGTKISLIDNGGQWSAYYNVQALDIQVAASSPELVRERQADAFSSIAGELGKMQDEQHVAKLDRITVQLTPSTPVVEAMSGDRKRAQGMTVVVGAAFTLFAVALLERRRLRRIQPRLSSARKLVPA